MKNSDMKILGESIADNLGNTKTEHGATTIKWNGPTSTEWMRLGETALGFWNHPEEDVYNENDGEPIK